MKATTMHRVKASIQINERGLQLLHESKWNEAIDTFHEALTVLLEDHIGNNVHEREDPVAWDRKRQLDDKHLGEVTETNVLFPVVATRPVADIHNEIIYIFDQGLTVRTELLDLQVSPMHYESLLVAVCFYNAGLSHHIVGLRNNSAQSLGVAAEHYSVSFARFLDCSESALGKVLELPLGILANVNNLSHLHACCRNMDQVAECIEELSYFLAICLRQLPQLKEECLVFLQNICFFQESVLCSAPAA